MKKRLPLASTLILMFGLSILSAEAQDWNTIVKKVASDRTFLDEFGYSVSISNNIAIIGAPFDNRDSLGNNSIRPGAAYIFEKNNNDEWEEKQKLFASDQKARDEFGLAVSMHNNTAIIRATRDSALQHKFFLTYFFERDTSGRWIEINKFRHDSISRFAIFPKNEPLELNDSIALIGTPYYENNGAVDIYKKDSKGNWSFFQKIQASRIDTFPTFGSSVSMSENGNTIMVGSEFESIGLTSTDSTHLAGAAYIFERDSLSKKWIQVQRLVSQDRTEFDYFGSSIVNTDEFAIISSPNKLIDSSNLGQRGAVYFFQKDTNGIWNEIERKVSSIFAGRFGGSLALDNNILVVGSGGYNSSGPVYIYEKRNNNTWTILNILNSPSPELNATFGNSVAISGRTALVADKNDNIRNTLSTAPRAGAIYFVTTCSQIDTIERRVCKSYQSISGNNYFSSGNYLDTIPTSSNCYYINYLNLTIDTIDVSVIDTASGKLIANATQARYQWLDCDSNFALIRGEFNKSFTPIKNGDYAVELIKNGCIDTSACYPITEVGLAENTFNFSVNLYPNPTNGEFTITLDGKSISTINASIYDIKGRLLLTRDFENQNILDLELNGSPGIYVIQLSSLDGKRAAFRVLKE